MENDIPLKNLKVRLAHYGAIKPQAWTKILTSLKVTEVKINESFNREVGTIAFIENGIFKEYDASLRKKPSIVNFISSGNFLITTKFNQSKYLKAITDVKIVYIDFNELASLYFKYTELKPIYDSIVSNYEEGISFRYRLLEERLAEERILLFTAKYRTLLSFLKKKDLANYMHLDYDYFVRMYGKLL